MRYSPLLLSQIPNRRSEQRRKWDATVPLDIAFFSLEQTGHEGDARRLLTLVRVHILLRVHLLTYAIAFQSRILF